MHDAATSSQNRTNLNAPLKSAAEHIRAEINDRGFIRFDRFMELALYCPECGFYDKESDTVGRRGDFYTSVSVGNLFGRLLAFQFNQWLSQQADVGSALQLVEAGAHDGRLAADVLTWFSERCPERFHALHLWLIEPSSRLKARQQRTLAHFGEKVHWAKSLSELGPVKGIIYSNELLDAMPLRRFGWDAGDRQWREWGVIASGKGFSWCRLDPVSDSRQILQSAGFHLPPELEAMLPDGFTVETSPAAQAWWAQAARKLACGKLVALDYGVEANELLLPQRRDGSLRSYRGHRVSTDVLADPGEQDITAHVNFTAIRSAGESAGLRTELFETQSRFLTAVVARAWAAGGDFGGWTAADNRQFKTLTHPEHLGRPFQALVQGR